MVPGSSSRTNLTMPSMHTRVRALLLTSTGFVGQSKILTVYTFPTSSKVMTAIAPPTSGSHPTMHRMLTDDDEEMLGRARG